MTSLWFELTIDVLPEHGDSVANFLMEHGSPGIESQELPKRTRLTAYFSSRPPIEALRRYCADISHPHEPPPHIQMREFTAEDWAENWKVHFQPQCVGTHLYICAPWATTPPPGRIAIVIDPGMAFGTGQHPTTRGCLHLLEWAAQNRGVRRAADVGTGSGILAIALAKLGVPEVWAIDIDANARVIAQANARHNHVDGLIHVVPSLDGAVPTFDVLVANLFADLLFEQASRLSRAVESHGLLICSGFLQADEGRVCAAYDELGLTPRKRFEEDSWVTLAFGRQTSP